MPMTPHDEANDERPAWGLRDEAFDDRLRELNPPPPGRGPAKLTDLRAGAFKNTRMCQTENILRTANSLAQCTLIVHDVLVTMAGYELVRREAKHFDVMTMMTKWGYVREPGNYEKDEWIGFYAKRHQPKKILLNFDKLDGHILARLVTGQRLVVLVTAGSLASTRSSTESKQLSSVIGRISRWKKGSPNDVFAIGLPRTERFRKLVADAREAEGVRRLGLLFLLVDRGGGFSGMPEIS
jgi:hypothetical protein